MPIFTHLNDLKWVWFHTKSTEINQKLIRGRPLMIWGGPEEISEMNLFFLGNPFRIKIKNKIDQRKSKKKNSVRENSDHAPPRWLMVDPLAGYLMPTMPAMAMPAIDEINAPREVLRQQVGKFLLKSIIALRGHPQVWMVYSRSLDFLEY